MILESRYIGKSVEESIRNELRRILSDDVEAMKLAEEILNKYVEGGYRAVKDFVNRLIEGAEKIGGHTKEG